MIARIDDWLAGIARRGASVLLLALSLALFLPGFFTMPPLDRDEPRFAQASRQMVASGDIIDIRFQDEARHKKPAGIYWLQSATIVLTGGGDAPIWYYRLPSLLAALAAVLLTARIAAEFLGPRGGLVAGLLFAGVFSLGMEARIAKTDAVLLLTVLGSQWVLARLWRQSREAGFGQVTLNLGELAAFWLAMSASLLVKGPVGPMVVGLTAVALAVGARRAGWLAALRPARGLLVTALLVLPWYVAISLRSDGGFWAASLGEDMLAKLAEGQEKHGAPPGSYLAAIWFTFFPASIALALSLPALWRARRSAAFLFAAAWVLPAWLVFEATPTKLTHYVLPLYPALALAVASVWDGVVTAQRRLWHWIVFGLVAALPLIALVAIAIKSAELGPVPWGPIGLGIVALVAAGTLAARALAQGRALAAAAGLALMGFASPVGVATSLIAVEAIWPAPRIVAAAVTADCPAPAIHQRGFGEPSLVFLSPGPVRPLGNTDHAAVLSDPCGRVLLPSAEGAPMQGAVALGRITGVSLGSGDALDLTLWAAP